MLKSKWLMLTLSGTLLLTVPISSNIESFQSTKQLIENKVDLTGMVQIDRFGMIKHPFEIQFEKDREEINKLKKIKEEEELRQQKELEKQKKNEPQWQEFVLTFYTSSISENSSAGAVTCQGKKLQPYMIANNIYTLGTQIYLEGYGTKTVSDRGSNKHFGTSNRLDVYIEREQGESESQYLKRVNGYGVKKVRGYIVK